MAVVTRRETPGDLFEPSVGTSNRIVFLTNRFNLLQILSAGFIAPKESYHKYYPDLLEIAPGRLPLLRGPLGVDLQDAVSGDVEASFPVALELKTADLNSQAIPSLRDDGHRDASPLSDDLAVAWAPCGAIPLTAVKQALFRSMAELEEHRARPYENIREDALSCAVDADLFTSGSLAREKLSAWLSGLRAPKVNSGEYFRRDKVSGALCFAGNCLQVAPKAQQAVLDLFSVRDSGDGAKTRSRVRTVTITAITLDHEPASTGDLNTRLFLCATTVLREINLLEGWQPAEVLGEIEVIARGKKLSKKDDAELTKNLDSIKSILRNERDFRPFKSDTGLVAAKALLLVLLRPEPHRLLNWSAKDTGATDDVTFTAAVFCGMLNGRERSSISVRPASLDQYLADRSAAELSTTEDSIRTRTPVEPVDVIADPQSKGLKLVAGEKVLLDWTPPPPAVGDLLTGLALTDSRAHAIALDVCRMLGWDECVVTQFSVDSGQLTIVGKEGKAKGITVSIRGWTNQSTSVVKEQFHSRVRESGIPAEYESAVRSRIERTE